MGIFRAGAFFFLVIYMPAPTNRLVYKKNLTICFDNRWHVL